MQVGIFNVWRGKPEQYVMADMLVRSCQQAMPDVPIVHLTDMHSPAMVGVQGVVRREHPKTAMLRIEHQRDCEGEWLFLDTDVLVQRDVRHVFDEAFDVAIADRVGCATPTEGEAYPLYQKMPYNSGIVFSRSSAFWAAVLHHMQTVPPMKQEWMGDQYAVCAVVDQHQFTVKMLPGRIYNCPPMNSRDRCEDAAIVHFKGPDRKQFMLQRFMEECYASV